MKLEDISAIAELVPFKKKNKKEEIVYEVKASDADPKEDKVAKKDK